MVTTVVGARCRDCAQLQRLPTHRLSARYYLRALGASTVTAVACGLAWGAITGMVAFFYLNLIIAAAVGYTIAEVTGLAVNRKRSKILATIGGIAVIFSYLVALFIPWGFHFHWIDLLSLALGITVVVTKLR